MKVLLVSDQFLKIEGENIYGTEAFTNTLKRLSKIGELYLCVRDASKFPNQVLIYNDNIRDYVKKENVAFISKSFIWPSTDTLRIIKEQIKKVDLVVGYVPALNAEVSLKLAHKYNKKSLGLMVACPWDGLWNQDWKRKIAAPYRFLLNKSVMKGCDYALYVTGQFLQHRYPTHASKSLGLSDVVLDKIDDRILDKRIKKIDALFNSVNPIIKLATTAMLNVRYKGQRFVFEALKELKDKGVSNYKYYLIGGGDDSELRNRANSLGIADMIEFVGKVTHDEVFRILDDMDIYIHPSLQEGLPRSVVEAMSRALPCIGSATGAIPELIDKDFIVKRKSSKEIAHRLLALSDPAVMKREAERNFYESKKFECERLDQIRNEFYEEIVNDIMSK